MPTIVCPTCATKLEIDDDMLGQDVQCGSCQQIFKAENETKRSSRRGEVADADEEKPRKSKYRKDDDEDDDERPSRRRKRMSSEDDDDDEDYDDRPSRRRRGRRGGQQEGSNAMGIASLVLGIIGLVGSLCCCLFLLADILAIIFGIIALKTPGKGMGIAGSIMGGIGLLLFVVGFIFNLAGGLGGGGGGGGFNNNNNNNRFK